MTGPLTLQQAVTALATAWQLTLPRLGPGVGGASQQTSTVAPPAPPTASTLAGATTIGRRISESPTSQATGASASLMPVLPGTVSSPLRESELPRLRAHILCNLAFVALALDTLPQALTAARTAIGDATTPAPIRYVVVGRGVDGDCL